LQLTNNTIVPAKLFVSQPPGEPVRVGLLVAKATFKFDVRGRVEIDTQAPLPLFGQDQETPSGMLPDDAGARRGELFEVILLGNAYPPRRPATATQVALTVGCERRELMVFGDRVWLGGPPQARISNPAAFDKMPLVYERAFGGTVAANIDRDSVVDFRHPINPRGKGYDAGPQARALCQHLNAPSGFPVFAIEPRPLPNLENPSGLIRNWEDAPDPAGWATVPRDTAIAFMPALRKEEVTIAQVEKNGPVDPDTYRADMEGRTDADPDQAFYRSHPDWRIARPAAAAPVVLENLLPEAATVQFALPQLRVVADYIIDGRQGKRDMIPQVLVLLPEEKRFYLVFRLPFTFDPVEAGERAFRLRLQLGWPQASPRQG